MTGLKRALLVGLAILIPLVLGIWRLARGPANVVAIDVDPDSAIGRFLPGADYVDAYRGTASGTGLASVDALIEAAFQRGALVTRSEDEVLYRDGAPGLTFYVSYRLSRAGPESCDVEMATVVHYESWKGRAYFTFVRPLHRLGVPWMLRRMLSSSG